MKLKHYALLSKMRTTRRRNRQQKGGAAAPYIIGICGGSGSGKSTLAEKLKTSLVAAGIPETALAIISTDNYFKPMPPPEVVKPEDFNGDLPEGCDLPFLLENIKSLKAKTPKVEIPQFDIENNKRADTPAMTLDGTTIRYVIVEGIFAFHLKEMREQFNLKIYAQLDTDICLGRRMIRDKAKYGVPEKDTMIGWQKFVKPSYVYFVEPTRIYADVIVNTSELSNQDKAVAMILAEVQKA